MLKLINSGFLYKANAYPWVAGRVLPNVTGYVDYQFEEFKDRLSEDINIFWGGLADAIRQID